jgi:hypothetical protein
MCPVIPWGLAIVAPQAALLSARQFFLTYVAITVFDKGARHTFADQLFVELPTVSSRTDRKQPTIPVVGVSNALNGLSKELPHSVLKFMR